MEFSRPLGHDLFQPELTPQALNRFLIQHLVIIFVAAMGGSISVQYTLYPYMSSKTQRVHFPGAIWPKKQPMPGTKRPHTPLRYVIGDTWPAGNIAYYAPERPHVLIKGDYSISPWVKPDDIQKNGGIFVWCMTIIAIVLPKKGRLHLVRANPRLSERNGARFS